MVIKNTTTITKESVKGVMYAANYDNKKYKTKKLIFNGGGLFWGMLFVSSLVPEMVYGTGNKAVIIICGILCGVFLLIGMYGMDINNMKKFTGIYGDYIDKTFIYEIDSEEILVKDKWEKEELVLWKNVIKWNEDGDNFYLFKNEDNALIISKKGFTECTAKDLWELATAVMYVRNSDAKEEEKDEQKDDTKGIVKEEDYDKKSE